MIETANIYIIHKKEVVLHGDYVSLVRENLEPKLIQNSENGYHPINASLEEIRVPVHAVVINGKTNLIAIEPEIKELIEKPLLEELEFQMRFSRRVQNNYQNLSMETERFNNMTKWQKIKFILKGNWV